MLSMLHFLLYSRWIFDLAAEKAAQTAGGISLSLLSLAEERTIFAMISLTLSSHILPELAEMCTSVGIINHGEMKMQGSIDEIQKKMSISAALDMVVTICIFPKIQGLFIQSAMIKKNMKIFLISLHMFI